MHLPSLIVYYCSQTECTQQEQSCTDLYHIHHLLHSSPVILDSVVGHIHTGLLHVLWLRGGPVQNQLPIHNPSFILHSSRLATTSTRIF